MLLNSSSQFLDRNRFGKVIVHAVVETFFPFFVEHFKKLFQQSILFSL